MNGFWRQLTSFFSGKCVYYDCCVLYRVDSEACNHDMGSWCGACRSFDEIGEKCAHYRKERDKDDRK